MPITDDLERQRGQLAIVLSRELDLGTVRHDAGDGWHIHRTGQIVDHAIEQFLNTLFLKELPHNIGHISPVLVALPKAVRSSCADISWLWQYFSNISSSVSETFSMR